MLASPLLMTCIDDLNVDDNMSFRANHLVGDNLFSKRFISATYHRTLKCSKNKCDSKLHEQSITGQIIFTIQSDTFKVYSICLDKFMLRV